MRYSALSAVVFVGSLWAGTASAQQTYPQTLYWGSGLVDVPVAWVAPLSGDFAINYSGKNLQQKPGVKVSWNSHIDSQLAMSMAAFGRLDLGFAAYSSNPEWGFFGKALLLREEDFLESGFARWVIPSLAVGARNVGPYSHIDRFGMGYDYFPGDPTTGNSIHVPDTLHKNFSTANTVYGVATKGFSLREIRSTWPDADFSVSVGYGNGLFKNDGGLGSAYAKHATGGLFYGAKLGIVPAAHMTLALMAENNAWDYNAGASLGYRGIMAGVYLTEIGAGSAVVNPAIPASSVFNYQKVAFTIGWQSNIFALLRGDFLQSKEAALLRQRQGLLAEIARRQQRIAQLELEINQYEAQNLLELEQRRNVAETQLREEREALRRLEQRLRRVEQQVPPPSPKP